jgi:uncharacterized protein (TIGR02611 family)
VTVPEATRAQRMRARLAERRAEHQQRARIYRLLVMVAGAAVTLAGLALLVLPGPAFVVIPIGLAMLALEFAWAERLLDRAIEHADLAQRKALKATTAQRVLAVLVAVALAAAALFAAAKWDIPLLPV